MQQVRIFPLIAMNDLLGRMAEFTEEEKDLWIKHFMEMRARDLTSISVIYNPNCGCEIEQFFLLDRFPMSRRILSTCPTCKKGCLMLISSPIVFHYELLKKDIPLKELPQLLLADDHYQKEWILKYLELALLKKSAKEFRKKNGQTRHIPNT